VVNDLFLLAWLSDHYLLGHGSSHYVHEVLLVLRVAPRVRLDVRVMLRVDGAALTAQAGATSAHGLGILHQLVLVGVSCVVQVELLVHGCGVLRAGASGTCVRLLGARLVQGSLQ